MDRNILMIIAPERFRDEELIVPKGVFQSQGWAVDVVSTQVGDAIGMFGATEPVEHTIADSLAADACNKYDALVIVGGQGCPDHLCANPDLHGLAVSFQQKGRVIGAICIAGVTLAKAGLLNATKATVWECPESLAAYQEAGAIYTGDPVTADNLIITGNGPAAAEEFARAVAQAVRTTLPCKESKGKESQACATATL